MKEHFDDHLLSEFMSGFYGYGTYDGDYWFVGMEEGGGNYFDDIAMRLAAWDKRGRNELEDVAEYHAEIGVTDFFGPRPKLQRTWGKLILALSHQEQVPTLQQLRAYQGTALGRANGETCLVELLPLPAQSTGHWIYERHSLLPHLADRDRYREFCLPTRIPHLQRRISEHKPKVVIFYGLNYLAYWQAISGGRLVSTYPSVLAGDNGSSLFVATKHPVARGVTNDYFHQIGRYVATRLSPRSK